MRTTNFKNKRVFYDSRWHASKHECECYKKFKLLLERKKITDLKCQFCFVLYPAVYYNRSTGAFLLAPFVPEENKKWKKPKGFVNLQPAYRYYADFVVYYPDGSVVVYDAKGVKTDEYLRKKKMMLKVRNIEVKEI